MVNGRPADGVPERIGERQGRAAFKHLGHCNAVGKPFVIRRAGGFECDLRLAEEFAVAPEAHLHGDLHARARLIERRRDPAGAQRRPQLADGVDGGLRCLRGGAARQRGERQRPADHWQPPHHGRSRLSTKRMAIGRPATAPPNPSLKCSGVQRSSAAEIACR